MTGKQKCKILKEIRKQIAEQNDIRFVIEECTHKGRCRGTCPKCEWEVRMLEKELEKRRASGKKVALAGISAGFLLSSCAPIDALKELIHPVEQPLEGDVMFEVIEGAPVEPDIPGETETVVSETREGDPVIDVPETELEEGETLPEEIVEIAGVPVMETDCETIAETEEEYTLAGALLPADFEEEESMLMGDPVYIPEEEAQP